KREGIFSLLINGLTLAVTVLDEESSAIRERLREPASEIDGMGDIRHETARILQWAQVAAEKVANQKLDGFVKGLERGLGRDTKRVYEYYETLAQETKAVMERKTSSQAESGEVSAEKLRAKLEAIEVERDWKIRDVISKHALTIQVVPVAALFITAQTPVFWIRIRRRLSSRLFPFTYNHLLRRFNSLPCESCGYPEGGFHVCDDALHIVCGNCFRQCPQCKRAYCSACHKDGCPKCRKQK
ncbi:MAG: hypothetical protein L7F78_18780, partial [Syntrophales bacterium LBB04]|nr:hypothetical protein [Syntrophales bacterium LBB04]